MNRHVAEASWLTDQSPAEENTWGHHQQRAWAVWLGKARLRAAQGMSARDGWVQTRKSGTIGSSATRTAASSVEEEGGRLAVHPPSRAI